MKRFVDAKWVTTPLFHHKPPTVVEEWVHVYDRAHKHFHLLKSIAECGGAKYEDAGEDAVSKETRIQAMAALRARMVDDGDEFNSVYEGSEEMATLIDNANVARVIARVMSNQKQNTYARSAAATENESFWQREKRRKSQQIRFETFWEFSDENPFVNQTRTLIFCNRIDNAQYASSFLKNYGVENVVVHDTLPVAMRMQRLNAFRQGQINVLVCTDILARGADLDVDHVIMLDFSLNPMSYLHRLGRTGRAGRVGLCTNMYTQQDQALIESLTEADKHDGNYEAAGSFRKKKPNDTAPPSPSFTGARGLKVGQQQQQRQNNNNKRERAEQSERSVVSKTSGNVVDVY
jgi:superfamily II DNA/RNA helicase